MPGESAPAQPQSRNLQAEAKAGLTGVHTATLWTSQTLQWATSSGASSARSLEGPRPPGGRDTLSLSKDTSSSVNYRGHDCPEGPPFSNSHKDDIRVSISPGFVHDPCAQAALKGSWCTGTGCGRGGEIRATHLGHSQWGLQRPKQEKPLTPGKPRHDMCTPLAARRHPDTSVGPGPCSATRQHWGGAAVTVASSDL